MADFRSISSLNALKISQQLIDLIFDLNNQLHIMMYGHFKSKLQVSGVGLFAGVPYLCAYQLGSYLSCMEAPSLVNTNLLIAGKWFCKQ